MPDVTLAARVRRALGALNRVVARWPRLGWRRERQGDRAAPGEVRSSKLPVCLTVWTLSTVGWSAEAASAEPRPEPILVEYAAPAQCPSGGEFLERLARHTTRWMLAAAGEPARAFLVTIEARGSAFAGTLRVRGTDAKTTERTIEGADCAEVARALAVITAITIDPRATIEPVSEPPNESRPPAPPPVPPPPPPPRIPPPAPAPPPALAPAAPAWRFGLSVEAGAGVTSAVVPGLLPVFGASVAGDLSREGARAAWFHPEAHLGVLQSTVFSVDTAHGRGELEWTAAVIELCPVRLSLYRHLDVLPCAGAAIGMLSARGVGVPDARLHHRPWLDGRIAVAVRWRIVGRLFVTAAGGTVVPGRRDWFELAPAPGASQPILLSRAPAAGADASLRLGWRF